jgi:hypothetical protein
MDQLQRPTDGSTPTSEPKPPSKRWALLRQREFWFGAGILVLMNGALVGLAALLSAIRARSSIYIDPGLVGPIALLANVLVPALLYKRRPKLVQGMLYTLAFLLLVGGVCLPVFLVGICMAQI